MLAFLPGLKFRLLSDATLRPYEDEKPNPKLPAGGLRLTFELTSALPTPDDALSCRPWLTSYLVRLIETISDEFSLLFFASIGSGARSWIDIAS
jgi:hypothetical protein